MLLHNPTILHTKTFFAPAYHPRKIYRCMSGHSTRNHKLLNNPTIIHTKTFLHQTVTRARKYCPLQNTFQKHIRVKTFPLSLLQGQGQGQGYVYGPISYFPTIGINQSARLHGFLLIFISTFFASTITITNTGECQTIHIVHNYYTLTMMGQCQVLIFRITNVRLL